MPTIEEEWNLKLLTEDLTEMSSFDALGDSLGRRVYNTSTHTSNMWVYTWGSIRVLNASAAGMAEYMLTQTTDWVWVDE